MARRIAVEDGLDNVREALRHEGFEVTKITQGTMANVDAAVITGMSNNFLGVHDTDGNKFPVIEASGMSARDVVDQIQSRLAQIEHHNTDRG
ncbi:MAG TPA: YkuS family protein [Symbiobacteriaceae bacterium]|jgi:hypothetical protein